MKRELLLCLFIALSTELYAVKGNNIHYNRCMIEILQYKKWTKTPFAPILAPKVIVQLPHYQIPKGNIFCRMEDYLTKRTGVWIKVGVWSPQK